jgi:hypothetical protein
LQLCGKAFRHGHFPCVVHGLLCVAIEQFSGLHAMMKFLETDGAVGGGALHEVSWTQVVGMGEASRSLQNYGSA